MAFYATALCFSTVLTERDHDIIEVVLKETNGDGLTGCLRTLTAVTLIATALWHLSTRRELLWSLWPWM